MEHTPVVPSAHPVRWREFRHLPRGFTLIELLVTIAIMGVLVALAVPSFKPTIERFRVRNAAEGLKDTLHFARSEAIKRGGNVVVQRIANNTITGCTTSNWDCGWQVCVGTACTTSNVLQRFDTPPKIEVSRTGAGASNPISFDRWGLPSQGLGFSLVPFGESTAHPATLGICMSTGGRIKTTPPDLTPCTP
jgi:type IV fimbrial biogenesis protein FimT